MPPKPSLVETHPDLVAQWHATKNGELTPAQVTAGSNKKVWWRCPEGPDHEWEATVQNRSGGRKCPFCAGQKVSVTNSLATLHPELAAEWHPTLNGEVTPEQVGCPGGKKKWWWTCPKGPDHDWQQPIGNRIKGSGCRCCANRQLSVTNALSTVYPGLVAEWHPEKNGDLTPDQVIAAGHTKRWWKCPNGPDHEWEVSVLIRGKGHGCPYCARVAASVTNSLATLHPELIEEWHPTKNGDLTPDQVAAYTSKKVWWKCSEGPDHEWEAQVRNRSGGRGCPFCAGLKVSVTNALATLHPELAGDWHPIKNRDLTPMQVPSGGHTKRWWKCPKAPDHEWTESVSTRALGVGCPFCAGKRVTKSNSLAHLHPDLVHEWHPTKNGNLTPEKVYASTNKGVWWQCSEADDHEWEAGVSGRTGRRGRGCPFCAGQKVTRSNSLAVLHPELVTEWHETKNGQLTAEHVTAGSGQKVWWRCDKGSDHEWETSPKNRSKGQGCPFCRALSVSITNSLATLHLELVEEWHPTKNGDLTPDQIVSGSKKEVWWRCPEHPEYPYETSVVARTRTGQRCPLCANYWSIKRVRDFVASLTPYIETMTPAELYLICQQAGLLDMRGVGHGLIKKIIGKKKPPGSTDPPKVTGLLLEARPDLADTLHPDRNPDVAIDQIEIDSDQVVWWRCPENPDHEWEAAVVDRATDASCPVCTEIELVIEPDGKDGVLPKVPTKEVLATLDAPFMAAADAEAVAFMVASASQKIWAHAYRDAPTAVAEAKAFESDRYARDASEAFLGEYAAAVDLEIPDGYWPKTTPDWFAPNLMQRHVAAQIAAQRRLGNWSGTGAGKTLSAILASRVIDAQLTVICCPNAVVDIWSTAIQQFFPGTEVVTKTLTPQWTTSHPRYLVLNYEQFQQPRSMDRVRALAEGYDIDMVVVDEIHFVKEGSERVENVSRRRQLVEGFVVRCTERKPDLAVLGMSATPVINNLHEGRSMVELVTGRSHSELETRATVSNCMRLYQQLVRLGTRWKPDYAPHLDEHMVDVDCTDWLEEIRDLPRGASPLPLEQILTQARLPVILDHIKPGTLIYTYYIDGIGTTLRDALEAKGWRVGFYIGDDKSGFQRFLDREIDVLIATAAIGTGVDGLQHVCDQLIINVLPWTRAEYDQLVGRVYRQGQESKVVTVVVPRTYADVDGERWSWCETKWDRLEFKRSIADAAVDGVVPEGQLQSAAQAMGAALAWLKRLDEGNLATVVRPLIQIPLTGGDPKDEVRRRRYGDFSGMNRRWNTTASATTHQRLQENQEEWAQYHTLYQEARKSWTVVPYKEVVKWCASRPGLVVGDFGCGEALVAADLGERFTVHSF